MSGPESPDPVDQTPDRPALAPDQLERVAIWGDLDASPVAHLEAATTEHAPTRERRDLRDIAIKIVLAVIGIWIFLIALALMRDGARGLAPTLNAAIETPLNALGLGWLGALLVLSGSPVAAASLALLDGGSLTVPQGYAMMVGSRLGAAFVVLVIGTIYALRKREAGRRAPISIGILALSMTFIAYVPGGLLGWGIVESGVLSGLPMTPPGFVFDGVRALTAPVVGIVETFVKPDTPVTSLLLFLAGVGLLLASFRIVDLYLPDMAADRDDERARWYVGPWAMFGIGLLVALATLSVSVALSILVPVVAKGYVRREQILPFIAGANITTLVDTFVVAVVLGNPVGPTLVVGLAAGVTIWTVILLWLAYQPMRQAVFAFQAVVLRDRARLLAFVVFLFAIPTAMLLLGR